MNQAIEEITVLLGDPRLPDVTKVDQVYSHEDLESVQRMKEAFSKLPEHRFRYWDDHAILLEDLRRKRPGFVVNFCDTGFYNLAAKELELVAYLDLLEIPYSGSGPSCLGLCWDKSLVRAIAAGLGVPVPHEIYYDFQDPQADPGHRFPALIKPSLGDGSVGITQDSVVFDRLQADAYLRRLQREWPGRNALIQEFLPGTEYGIGLIGNCRESWSFLPALEVDYSGLDAELPPILSYESKTVPDSPYWKQLRYRAAELTGEELKMLQDYCRRLFKRLGCRDYARFDFRRDQQEVIKLIEVNPNPAWCWDGKLNIMAGFGGLSYSDLLRLILEAALRRVDSTGQGMRENVF